MSSLDNLTAQVSQSASIEASAVALIQGLATEIEAAHASKDDSAMADLVAKLKSSSDALAAAVTANTAEGVVSAGSSGMATDTVGHGAAASGI